MNETGADLLAQLRDSHAAGEPSWWPPAPGWWLLAAVALVLLVLALREGLRRLKVARRRRALLQAVDVLRHEHPPEDRPHDYLAALNQLFRVVALRAFPDKTGARPARPHRNPAAADRARRPAHRALPTGLRPA